MSHVILLYLVSFWKANTSLSSTLVCVAGDKAASHKRKNCIFAPSKEASWQAGVEIMRNTLFCRKQRAVLYDCDQLSEVKKGLTLLNCTIPSQLWRYNAGFFSKRHRGFTRVAQNQNTPSLCLIKLIKSHICVSKVAFSSRVWTTCTC